MALKKRIKTKEPTMEEMFLSINDDFIKNGASPNAPIPQYVISSTTGLTNGERFLICDSRDEDDHAGNPDYLPFYYGSTIEEAVANCYYKNG